MRSIRSARRRARAKVRPAGPAAWIATWFGTGALPRMPGTWGSLAALPCAWILVLAGGPGLLLAAALALFGAGLWASARYMDAVGIHDPAAICVDEVVGQWLTLLAAPTDPLAYLLGFVLFRSADMVKIWPASWVDRAVGGPIGVMLDDVIAALYAGVALFFLVQWLPP